MTCTRRMILTGMAGAGLAGTLGKSWAESASSLKWPGVSVMKGDKRGYANTPMGQVHYRMMGQGTPLYTAEEQAQRLARPHWERWVEAAELQ